MQLLKQKILSEGIVLSEKVLKVDSFLNQQIDPVLTMQMGEEFANRFQNSNINRVLTIEASGIPAALATGLKLGVPVVFARKKKSVLMTEAAYSTEVFSYTKQEISNITVLKKFMPPGENVLIIDDILARGEAALGLTNIVRQAGSTVAGIGIVIEKSFQEGADKLREAGFRLESLARVASLANGQITLL